ncbi:MAG TPA: cation-translocating P-type ATPase [Mogibacterium sp.]|nr:cation-translocating P-type ATPase [Mogibacterium sp.]
MKSKELNTAGITTARAQELQITYGRNELTPQKKESFFRKVMHIVREPMFILLLIAAIIYFILGEPRDGAIMLIFVVGIISIEVIQEWKTDRTLNALKELSAPHIEVIRDGVNQTIASTDLVPGDLMIIYEGDKIPADGFVIKSSDLCVDESSLTGESEGVWKVTIEDSYNSDDYWKKNYCYAGTLVTQGSGYIVVDTIGTSTEYGKIGSHLVDVKQYKTPLQKQTDTLVKVSAILAAVLFILVGIFTFLNIPDHSIRERIIESILSGITLAMAMIPEEFPVVLTVFLSMGAWRLAKKNSLVHNLPSVETLGAISVLCVDKTGTITMNQMQVQEVRPVVEKSTDLLISTMGMACETETYDPMEKAMLSFCESHGFSREYLFSGELITEYPFTNELKMMGHVWRRDGKIVIAAKGSPEMIFSVCDIADEERERLLAMNHEMSASGLRVIAVAAMYPNKDEDIPVSITDTSLILLGLIGLADPPRPGIQEDIAVCNKAGIRVVMITGDNGITASSIAKKIGMLNYENIITGDMLNNMTDEKLREKVKDVSIFSRVIPEHKMRIVKAFQDNCEIVAMTGDGVNDAPALKAADIGIAMGKKGSEVSREAADLILMDDNFRTIVETIKDGRRIYDNIRKSVGYIFTIHIPIAFSSLLAPMLGIAPGMLFLLPLHVVLLELIIDPTCSIVLERQPAERDIMERNPRPTSEKLLTRSILLKSIMQGLIIFAASFTTYFIVLGNNESNATVARAMGLSIIILSNLLLVQVNSSDHDYVFQSIKRLTGDKVMWAVNVLTLIGLLAILYTPISEFLKLAPLNSMQFLYVFGISIIAVMWYEFVKFINKIKRK